ncbi:SAM-dependent methyltransferase [Mycobacterium noviomagense]|uniref:S-adenosyl-L-methionine-dependent methyltransferase n=1 Tax=Mycobacterium noviomagense TaxID=459858 RepID=A0A7I7PFF6_9MYCO|nr:class I SAM-dependent methyltransferase [Mycobacterium noviomagense]ORB13593.1 SAM-dependent methyltransferase [Mycobacterium noviomagense]BBY07265.1 putative S-adenosyl-L-methionine-dependent methyltransferase [Mycobacterium noviomagense]
MGNARFDGDTWDLASSVGATATLAATARAIASRAPNAIIDDPLAEPLVRAVGIDFCTKLASGELEPSDVNDEAARSMRAMTDWMAVRTKYFDDFFSHAARAGIRQAVILASGLDSRAYRLPWPPATTVFEVDQPQVIEFKTTTLAGLGAQPTADRRTVAVDLRSDWATALKQAGFDPTQPAAWIAEGLLGYLPADVREKLLDQVTVLSVPGSRFATHWLPNVKELDEDKLQQRMQNQSGWWHGLGFELDMTELMYLGERTDVADYLASRGWKITVCSTAELLDEQGLPAIDAEEFTFPEMVYLSGELTQR